ncbi:hypothetical protein YC2023_040645 [Brassica napus]
MRFLLHLLLLFQNPNHKRYKVEVDTDAHLAQGWTTDDRHTINRATRRKNSQKVRTMKLIPQQKHKFRKMKGLRKGSKARVATVLGRLSL